MFSSVLTGTAGYLSISQIALCTLVSVLCGMIVALSYRVVEPAGRNFLLSVVILPAVVQLVILMVNGNLGAGVAVAGSFSLVKFRSLPGKASDIVIIFLAMASGLLTGMGYIWLALCAAVSICAVFVLIGKLPLFEEDERLRTLRITIPEDLDYITVFDDIFARYASKCRLIASRTVSLGTMYQLTYELHLKDAGEEKQMIDALRARNGNLGVVCGHAAARAEEL